MRGRAFVLALLLALVAADRARAVIGANDRVPAATLLFPYFEVDPASPVGRTTLIAIQNASPMATLARVTLWTDLGIPTLGFDVYLVGYDVQSINVADILVRGFLPRTASVGQDPSNLISPRGLFSQDINYASCTAWLPYPQMASSFTPEELADLRAAHAGTATSAGTCAGAPRGDGILRGYVTIDTSVACRTTFSAFPTDAGHFAVTSDQNALLGEFVSVNLEENFAESEAAVHIEADPALAGGPTFYQRLPSAAGGVDHRETLPSRWSVPVKGGRADGTETEAIVWRDPGAVFLPFPCDTVPVLSSVAVAAYDEQSGRDDRTVSLPTMAGTVRLDPPSSRPDVRFGWVDLALPGQSWVIGRWRYEGRFSAAATATVLP